MTHAAGQLFRAQQYVATYTVRAITIACSLVIAPPMLVVVGSPGAALCVALSSTAALVPLLRAVALGGVRIEDDGRVSITGALHTHHMTRDDLKQIELGPCRAGSLAATVRLTDGTSIPARGLYSRHNHDATNGASTCTICMDTTHLVQNVAATVGVSVLAK